jgi:hypothetical protein
MRKFTNRVALLSTTAARAFETGKPGWKMDGDKLALDGNGNPIYVKADGTEQSVQGDTISNLNAEAKTHRTAKETAETALAKYKDESGKLIDPEIAVKAVKTVAGLDAKTLIDAGEVDRVKETIRNEFTGQLTEAQRAIEERDNRINGMMVDGVFKGSEFIAERVAMPRDFFEAAMRSNFKVEEGKVAAYDRSGNRLMSKKNVGEYADPNEALELLVEMHPQKDTILKAPAAGGSGNGGGGGNRGRGATMRRSDFEALPPGEQAAVATKGEVQIVD